MRQSSMISLGQSDEISRFSEELKAKVINKKCREDAVSKIGSRSNPRIFAMIEKISLGLRKFRNSSEIGKFRNPSKIGKFR